MAKGLAVVEAIFAGKRVKHGERGWLQWDPVVGKFRREDGTEWWASSRQLLADDWTIEPERPMAFAEAHARMRKGDVVELPMDNGGILQYRIRGDSYEMREGDAEGAWSAWDESLVGVDCVEATTWRVAGLPQEQDSRPTWEEARAYLAARERDWMRSQPALTPDEVLVCLQRWRPSMFREEATDDAD